MALSEQMTVSQRARVVTIIPKAGPLTTATKGLGKSMKELTKFSNNKAESLASLETSSVGLIWKLAKNKEKEI